MIPPASHKDLVSGINDPRCHEVTADVLEAFMGPPPPAEAYYAEGGQNEFGQKGAS